MPDEYSIGHCRGELAIVFYEPSGRRRRYSLKTADPAEARRRAPAVFAELTRPKGQTVAELWEAYRADRAGRRVAEAMTFTWKTIGPHFGYKAGDQITISDCRSYIAQRRAAGKKDGTITTELGHLRGVLLWAVKHKLLKEASYIEKPPRSAPADHFLTREQCKALLAATTDRAPHIKTFVAVALGTAARNEAILSLTWDRVDFERGMVDLRDPTIKVQHKQRALVPMNNMVRQALEEAKRAALTDYVVEWAAKRVKSVKHGLANAAEAAGCGKVSPHVLRHTAAVHMAEDGISMEVIAQYLGHNDINTTRRVYARYSPTYLRNAASSLEY